jgi:very-short-patch-repair endonuclease
MSSDPVSPVERLTELGGVATRGTLLRSCARGDLDRAVAAGDLVVVGRGLLALAAVDQQRRTAARLGAVLGLTSAALHHGWAVKNVPDRPQVMVSRGQRVTKADRRVVRVHRAELGDDEVDDGVTTALVTLAQCMRRLPFDEALCIADSALRSGVAKSVLLRIADRARGPGSAQMRRVAGLASADVANPFESCLHAIAADVPGLDVRPQVTIREQDMVARPDFVDAELRIVLEADSFEWHGGRAQLSADARRYDLLVVNGWIVLRFSYEHVMTQPAFIRRVLVAAVDLARALNEGQRLRASAA